MKRKEENLSKNTSICVDKEKRFSKKHKLITLISIILVLLIIVVVLVLLKKKIDKPGDSVENYDSNSAVESIDEGAQPTEYELSLNKVKSIKYKTDQKDFISILLNSINTVLIGHYSQGEPYVVTPIEWVVLDVDIANNQALLISKDIIDRKQYNEENVDITWKTSSLRLWLNQTFYKEAFSSKEMNMIKSTDIATEDIKTKDKIFILSEEETYKYIPKQEDRDLWFNYYENESFCLDSGYWLRSNSHKSDSLYAVDYVNNGETAYPQSADCKSGVRPAMWVDLNSLLNVKSTLEFGSYLQDVKSEKKPIEWIVLSIDKKNERLMLISRSILDSQEYSLVNEKTTWEDSNLREWANTIFFDNAFSSTEKNAIQTTNINTENIITQDKVFILSLEETLKYLPEQWDRETSGPEWDESTLWGLRSNSIFREGTILGDVYMINTLFGFESNSEMGNGYNCVDDVLGVRPVIWIDTSVMSK